jgi:type I restriction enzyme S subunit
MTYGFRPYPACKESGVPWLGEIPASWKVARNGRLFVQRNETGYADLPILEVSLKTGIRVRQFAATARKQMISDREKSKRACAGDVAYNMMRMWQGAVGVSPVDGLVSPAYVVARPLLEVDSRYFAYLFRTDAYMNEVDKYSHGIVKDRNRLYWEDFKQMPSPWPPLAEQAAIVRFLNHVERRIRRCIIAKRGLIALLNEQKQAIIHRAVTRGLDPSARLKPSGVAWLGDVPEHWDVVRLGRLIELTTGFPFSSGDFSQDPSDVRLLRGINVVPGAIRWGAVVRWSAEKIDDFAEYALAVGDIVLGMDRPIISSGVRVAKVGPADLPSLVLQRVARIRPRDQLLADFMLLLLGGKSFADYVAPISTGISVPHISPEQIGSFRVPLPDPPEQSRIIDWVNKSTATLTASTLSANRAIELLREYRTRLITDVVTGKIDVREAAARVLDEPEEAESLDGPDALADGDEEGAGMDLLEAAAEAEE